MGSEIKQAPRGEGTGMSATRRETRAQIPAKGQGVMATVWLFILATWRLGAVVFGLMLCVSAVAWKVSQLQVVEKEFLQGQGDNRAIRTIPIAANRGVIFDRNGWQDWKRGLES